MIESLMSHGGNSVFINYEVQFNNGVELNIELQKTEDGCDQYEKIQAGPLAFENRARDGSAYVNLDVLSEMDICFADTKDSADSGAEYIRSIVPEEIYAGDGYDGDGYDDDSQSEDEYDRYAKAKQDAYGKIVDYIDSMIEDNINKQKDLKKLSVTYEFGGFQSDYNSAEKTIPLMLGSCAYLEDLEAVESLQRKTGVSDDNICNMLKVMTKGTAASWKEFSKDAIMNIWKYYKAHDFHTECSATITMKFGEEITAEIEYVTENQCA